MNVNNVDCSDEWRAGAEHLTFTGLSFQGQMNPWIVLKSQFLLGWTIWKYH